MQPYTRRSRSSFSLPTHSSRVTSTLPEYDEQEKETNTTHAIKEAITCTSFPIQQKKKAVAKFDIDNLNGMLQVIKQGKNGMHERTSCCGVGNEMVRGIIMNFYTKTAYTIIQSRRRTESTQVDKWFYLEMADMMSLKTDLSFWYAKVNYPPPSNEPPSTLAIHIYLDTTHLPQDIIYKFLGDYMPQQGLSKAQNKKHIILESWFLLCKKPVNSSCLSDAFNLPCLYKQFITFFRALYSLTRLLPGFSLYKRLQESDTLSLCYRLGPSMNLYLSDELPPDQPFVTGISRKQSALYEFSEMDTPIGTLQLKVHYRIPFAMDDIYDTEGFGTNQLITISPPRGNIKKSQHEHHQDHQNPRRQTTIFRSQSSPILYQMRGSSMLSRDTRVDSLDQHDSSNGPTSNMERGEPPLCISPFKSPCLSPLPTSSTSTTAISTTVSNFLPIVEKSKSSTVQYGSSSRKGVFSSSFDKRKIKTSLSRRNSTETSSSRAANEISTVLTERNDLEDFMHIIKEMPDLKLFQGSRTPDSLNTTTNMAENNTHYHTIMWTPPVLDSANMNTSENDLPQCSKASLGYYYTLRYAHSDLSESLASTSSTMPRNHSTHRQSSSSNVTDLSLYDASLSSSSFYQSHRHSSAAAAPPTPMLSAVPIDTHSRNDEPLSRSLMADQAFSSPPYSPEPSPKLQNPKTPSKSSSQLSTMETLLEEDDTLAHKP